MNSIRGHGHRPHRYRTAISLMCIAASALTRADSEDERGRRLVSLVASLGVQQWPAVRDIATQPDGSFGETGLNPSLRIHVLWQQTATAIGRSAWISAAPAGQSRICNWD